MNGTAPSFAQQRVVFLALLGGMVAYGVVVALVVQSNEGRGIGGAPIEALDFVTLGLGAVATAAALVLRAMLHGRAGSRPREQRAAARFTATLLPLAILEGGCMLALTAWLLNGTMFPNLAIAMLLLLVAIVVVPLHDPDAGDGGS
jgi:hypothetical protein